MQKIYALLNQLGVTPNYRGYFQVAYAVYLSVQYPQRLLLVTKWLYPEVARYTKATYDTVERNIRTVVRIAWNENSSLLEQLARHPLHGKPSPSQFLAILTAHFSPDTAA